MAAAGKSFESIVYDGATVFLKAQEGLDANRRATEDAWPRTLAFLRRHLADRQSRAISPSPTTYDIGRCGCHQAFGRSPRAGTRTRSMPAAWRRSAEVRIPVCQAYR